MATRRAEWIGIWLLVAILVLCGGANWLADWQEKRDVQAYVDQHAAATDASIADWRDELERERRRRLSTGERGSWGLDWEMEFVYAGTPEGAIEIWNVSSPRPVAVLEGHPGDLVAQVYGSHSDGWLQSTGMTSATRTWDLESHSLVEEYEPELPWPEFVSYAPDGKSYAYWGRWGLRPFDPETDEPIHYTLGWVHAPILDAGYLSDSRRIITESRGRVDLYDWVSAAQVPASEDWVEERVLLAPVWSLVCSPEPHLADLHDLQNRPPTTPQLEGLHRIVSAVHEESRRILTLAWALREGATETTGNAVLTAWKDRFGEFDWERVLPTEKAYFLHAPEADHVVVVTPTQVHLIDPLTGESVHLVELGADHPPLGVVTRYARTAYTADRDGNLITVDLRPPESVEER